MLDSLKRSGLRAAYPLLSLALLVTRMRVTGANCVLLHEGEVLLVRHTYGDRSAWELPGGHVRRGEDPAVAVRREVREELGIETGELHPLGRWESDVWRRRDTVHAFAAQLADREFVRDGVELADARWFEVAALPRPLGLHVREMVAASLAVRTPVRPGDAGPDRR